MDETSKKGKTNSAYAGYSAALSPANKNPRKRVMGGSYLLPPEEDTLRVRRSSSNCRPDVSGGDIASGSQTIGRNFKYNPAGPDEPPLDSLQLFSLTLEVIKDVIKLSRNISGTVRSPDPSSSSSPPSFSPEQKSRALADVAAVPSKLEMLEKYVSLIVGSLGFGVMITLAAKDFERDVKAMCAKADLALSRPPSKESAAEMTAAWMQVTTVSTALLEVLKERKFLIDKEAEKEEETAFLAANGLRIEGNTVVPLSSSSAPSSTLAAAPSSSLASSSSSLFASGSISVKEKRKSRIPMTFNLFSDHSNSNANTNASTSSLSSPSSLSASQSLPPSSFNSAAPSPSPSSPHSPTPGVTVSSPQTSEEKKSARKSVNLNLLGGQRSFEISSPIMAPSSSSSINQPASARARSQSEAITVGLAPKPNAKMFSRFDELLAPLTASSPPLDRESVTNHASALQRHMHAVGKSVTEHFPDLSFAIDYIHNTLHDFLQMAQKQDPSQKAKLEELASLFRSQISSLMNLAVSNRRSQQVDLSQFAASSVHPSDFKSSLPDFSEMISNRRMAIEEVIQTERNYLAQLNELESLFISPLRVSAESSSPIVEKRDFDSMFGTVSIILKIVQDHFPEMEEVLKQKSLPIGSMFLKVCPWLKHYTIYVYNFDESVKNIQSLKKKSPAMAKFFRDAERKSTTNYDLSSYLILPVQRLGRYELLLKRVMECTAAHHPDFADVRNALANVGEINRQINNYKKAEDNRQKIDQITKNFASAPKVPLYSDGRLLVRDGKAMLWSGKGTPSVPSKESYLILFDDILLVCKIKKDGKYEEKMKIQFTDQFRVTEGDRTKEGYVSVFIQEGGKGANSHCIFFDSDVRAKAWLRSLREILSAVSLSKELVS